MGGYWNASTASAFTSALQGQYASVNPSSVTASPVDFPVAMGVTLQGVSLNAFNSVPHLQDRVQDAIGQDASVNGTSQVTLGRFVQSSGGLYLPFTIDNLGDSPTTANDIVSSIFTDNELIGTSSALSTTLATAGIQCTLAWAPPTAFPTTQPDQPSIGVILQVNVGVSNSSEAVEAVSVNLFDDGLLFQELAVQGVTLGPLYGGAVVQTKSVYVTAPGGVAVAAPLPAYTNSFIGTESASGSGSASAAPARLARSALAAAAAALALAAAVAF